MAEVRIKDVNDALWRKIKSKCALRGITVRELILRFLEAEARKEK